MSKDLGQEPRAQREPIDEHEGEWKVTRIFLIGTGFSLSFRSTTSNPILNFTVRVDEQRPDPGGPVHRSKLDEVELITPFSDDADMRLVTGFLNLAIPVIRRLIDRVVDDMNYDINTGFGSDEPDLRVEKDQ